MKRFLTIFAAAAALLVAGCQKAEVEDNLNIGSTTIVVSNAGATQDIVFTANTDWTIASDQAWVTFDREKGVAGKVTVTLTIAANETTDDRTAKVTVKAGSKETVFTIEQKAVTGFASSIEYKIDGSAQDITIGVAYNVEYTVMVDEQTPWLTVAKTKAAVEEGSIVIHADANPQFSQRAGTFTIAGPGFQQVYAVTQAGGETKAISASGRYVGLRGYFYNDEYQTAPQYVIDMETEDGNTVSVALNLAEEVEDPLALPVGKFIADVVGTMGAGTFSLPGYKSKYYAKVIAEEEEILVVDGEVNISVEGEETTISAALVGEDGVTYFCVYKGVFEESVKDDFEVMVIPSVSKPVFNSCTNTYYKSKANEWTLTFWVTAAPSDDVPALAYIPVTLYSAAGDPASLEIPEGTYTYTDLEVDYSKNGNSDFQPGTFTISMNTADQTFYEVLDKEATLKLTKNADGTYKFELNAKIGNGYYRDADWNPVPVEGTYDYAISFDSVEIPEAEVGLKPHPAGDDVFSTQVPPNIAGLFFGQPFGEEYKVIIIQINYIEGCYNVTLPLCLSSASWEFIPMEGRPSYTANPLPEGRYNFSKTAGDKTIIPALYNGQKTYQSVNNTWAGVVSYPSGGFIEISNGQVTFGLETTTADNQTFKYTGTFASSVSAIRNYSSYSNRITLPSE